MKIILVFLPALFICVVSSWRPIWAEENNGAAGSSVQKLLTTLPYLSGYVPAKKELTASLFELIRLETAPAFIMEKKE